MTATTDAPAPDNPLSGSSFERPPSSIAPEARPPPIPSKRFSLSPNVRDSRPSWQGEARDMSNVLRNRLNQLEYFDEFSLDSAALVQKLLSDLIQTTETARKYKSQLDGISQEKAMAQEQVAPLKNEIIRLTAENNHLHQDLIQLADEREARERRSQQAGRKLESQTADLRFMATQYAKRVEIEQKRADEARDRAEQVMTKLGLFQSLKGEKNVASADKLFQRLQKIDVETGLEPLQQNPVYFTPPDPAIADMLKLSEARIDNLQLSKKDLEAKIFDLENEVICVSAHPKAVLLREQMSKRDREITRLGAQLEVSRSQQFGALQPTHVLNPSVNEQGELISNRTGSFKELPAARERIEQLELQIEYLQDHVDALEKELSTFDSGKKEEVSAYKAARDKMAEDLRNERDRSEGLLKNLTKLQTMVKDLESLRAPSRVDNALKEASRSAKQIADLTQKLKDVEVKLRREESLLETARKKNESKYLVDLSPYKKELVAELNVARSSKLGDGAASMRASISEPGQIEDVQSLKLKIKDLEAEKWTLTNEIKTLQNSVAALSQSTHEGQNHEARSHTLQAEMNAKHAEIVKLIARIEELEKQDSQSLEVRTRLAQELGHAQGERDQLMDALEKFQVQLSELQEHAEKVTAERDNLAGLYSQVNQELQVLRSQESHAAPAEAIPADVPPPAPVTLSTSVLENSKDRERIHELEEQIRNLEQDLKVTVVRQRETGASANEALRQLENEMDGLRKSIDLKEAEIHELKETIANLEAAKIDSGEEAKAQLKVIESQKAKINQLEMERERDRFQMREVKSKFSDTEIQFDKFQSEITRLEGVSQERLKQIEEQRELLKQIDGERDAVQTDLDAKAEKIVELQDTVKKLKNQCIAAEQDNNGKREQIDLMNHHLNQQDKEISSIQRQMDSLMRERDFLALESARNAEEAKNLGTDLTAITRENQMLNSELVEVAGERDRNRAELSECERQVQYLDELCRVKEQEKEQLMASYRKLISEHERLDLTLKTSAEESDSMRMEVVMRDKRVQQLQKNLNDTSAELAQYKIDLAAYEKQCNNLTRSLATAERTLKHLEMDKARMVREMSAARDLAQGLERRKDEIQKNLTVSILENEQLENAIRKLEAERESLNNQLRAEKVKSDRLEHMVAMERTRKIQTEMSAQDMQASRVNQDENLKALNEQQSLSLAAMSRELVQANENVVNLSNQIKTYEALLSRQKSEAHDIEVKLQAAYQEISHLSDEIKTKELIIQDLMNIQRDKYGNDFAPTEVDQKLIQELASTKRELETYEQRIALKIKQPSEHSMSTGITDNTSEPSMGDMLHNPVASTDIPRTVQMEDVARRGSQQLRESEQVLAAIEQSLQRDKEL